MSRPVRKSSFRGTDPNPFFTKGLVMAARVPASAHGSTRTRWTGGRLLTAAALLTAAGTFLLHSELSDKATAVVGGGQRPQPAPPSQAELPAPESAPAFEGQPADPARSSAQPQVIRQHQPGWTPSPSATGRTALPSPLSGPAELPPPGSGPAADPLIQQALDQASAADLSPEAEQQVLALARTAWLAETAGYTQVRIQAATARRDTPPPAGAASGAVRAVVRLVWAGADPAGTFLDCRTATVRFTQNGDGSWKRTL